MSTRSIIVAVLCAALLATGCAAPPAQERPPEHAPERTADQTPGPSAGSGPAGASGGGTVLGYVNGTAIRQGDLWPALLERAGGEVLEEVVLDQLLRERFAQRGLTLTAEDIADELTRLSAALSPDADEAARLLAALRERRGLGDDRFDRLLRRNAGLRKLIAGEVAVTDAAVRRAFALRYGPRYRVRLIVAPDARTAGTLRQRAAAGESFSDLATQFSTDPSAAQGGLLSPISPADPTYPQVLRNILPELEPQKPSGVVALDGGFGILWLEETVPAQPVAWDDVREALAQEVRAQAERLLMEQTARAMLQAADVLILDPALKPAWK